MPDVLAVFFTLNTQSIEGAATAAESVLAQRRRPGGEPGIQIFPVPSRVDYAEKEKLELAREVAQERFAALLWHIPESERVLYWGRIEVPYQPFYAYEEILATFADKPYQMRSVLAALEVVTEYITDHEVRSLPPLPEEERLELLSRSVRQPKRVVRAVPLPPESRHWCYLSYAPRDLDVYMERFFEDLTAEVQVRTGSDEAISFFDVHAIGSDRAWTLRSAQALASCHVFVSIFSPRYFASESAGKEFAVFLKRVRHVGGLYAHAIIPVEWVPFRDVPRVLRELQIHRPNFPKAYTEEGLWQMMKLRSKYHEQYQEVVSELAKAIVEGAYSSPPPLEELPEIQNIPNPFRKSPAGAGFSQS